MSQLPPLNLPKGAKWKHKVKFRAIPKILLWILNIHYRHLLSDVWQAGYRQGAKDARMADRMAEIEKMPTEAELVTRTNQRVELLTRRDEFARIGFPWSPFD